MDSENAVEIFMEANTELMDGTNNREPYREILRRSPRYPWPITPTGSRLRRVGSMLIIDLDIEVDPAMTVYESHKIALNVEKAIKEALPDVYDVIVHIEPLGNVEDEKFGLTARDIAH